jgi:serine/threonine protein kinase
MGLVYLHSQSVVHGDLKAVSILMASSSCLMKNYFQQNVLIDDSGSALLCDFGLASVKADVTSRTTVINTSETTAVAGSRQWMAPERLTGKSLTKPCDIYAFGMTAYEVR